MNPQLQQLLDAALAWLQQRLTQPSQPVSPAPAPLPSPTPAPGPAPTPAPAPKPSPPLYRHPLLHNLLQQMVPLLLNAAPLLLHGA